MSPQLQAMYWIEEIGIAEYAGAMVARKFDVDVVRVDTKLTLVRFYIDPQEPAVLADPLVTPPYVQIGFRKTVKKWLAKRKGLRAKEVKAK